MIPEVSRQPSRGGRTASTLCDLLDFVDGGVTPYNKPAFPRGRSVLPFPPGRFWVTLNIFRRAQLPSRVSAAGCLVAVVVWEGIPRAGSDATEALRNALFMLRVTSKRKLTKILPKPLLCKAVAQQRAFIIRPFGKKQDRFVFVDGGVTTSTNIPAFNPSSLRRRVVLPFGSERLVAATNAAGSASRRLLAIIVWEGASRGGSDATEAMRR